MSSDLSAAWKEWAELSAPALRALGQWAGKLSVLWPELLCRKSQKDTSCRHNLGLFQRRVSLRPRTVLTLFPAQPNFWLLVTQEDTKNASMFLTFSFSLIKNTHNDKSKSALFFFFQNENTNLMQIQKYNKANNQATKIILTVRITIVMIATVIIW